MEHTQSPSDQLKLVIGFDIGTAYSSVAFALAPINIGHPSEDYQSKASSQEPITVSFNGRCQVGSQLAWCESQSSWIWGDYVEEQVEDGGISEADRMQMIKLCLEGSERTLRMRKQLEASINRLPSVAKKQLMTPDCPDAGALMAMYLKLLWEETKAQIKGHYTTTIRGNVFDVCPVESWISVPKLWSPQINAIMVAAANWAGLPDIHLVHEPEAAAALCLLEQSERALRHGQPAAESVQGIHLGTLDSILILDAGCGTVDLMTYLIEARTPDFVMKEAVPGIAGLDGSGLLNQYFQDHLEPFIAEKLPTPLLGWGKTAALEGRATVLAAAVKGFEDKKKQFGSSLEKAADKPMRIRVPGLPKKLRSSQYSLASDYLEIPRYPISLPQDTEIVGLSPVRDKISELFEKIVAEIIKILKQQIMAFNKKYPLKIECIMFVGGLSGNQYVFDRLKDTFVRKDAEVGYAISVLRPYQDFATVVSKGSVLRALYHPVSRRILTQSYGFRWDEEYDLTLHGEAEVVRDYHDGVDIVEDRMLWLCKVGDTIETDKPTVQRMRGWRGVAPKGSVLLEEPLFASYTETRNHVAAHSDGIIEVGRVESDLSHVDRSKFRKDITYDAKKHFVRLEYEIKLTFDGMQLNHELIIPKDGRWWKWNGKSPKTDEHWGPEPYKETNVIRLNAAAFDVSGYGACSNLQEDSVVAPKQPKRKRKRRR